VWALTGKSAKTNKNKTKQGRCGRQETGLYQTSMGWRARWKRRQKEHSKQTKITIKEEQKNDQRRAEEQPGEGEGLPRP
jgi:hypothetical protein